MALAAVLTACRGGGGPDIRLDGSPRHPDDEGLVTAVSHESVTLDGERTYDIDRDLICFSSLDLSAVPVLYTEGQYVQIGLDGDTAEWIGTIAKPLTTEPPRVVVLGEIESIEEGSLVFDDGLVLRAAPGLDASPSDGDVQVFLDPERGVVTEVQG